MMLNLRSDLRSNRLGSAVVTRRPTVAIIGSGVSGALVAVHLLKTTQKPLDILLIDRTGAWGKGVAYSTPHACHLLNVPVGKISAFADQPDHFRQWLQHADPQFADASAFVPRKLYGQYIQSILEQAEQAASPVVQLVQITDEVISLTSDGLGARLEFCSGTTRFAEQVVLALGNLPPGQPTLANPAFYQSCRYLAWAWADPDLSHIAADDTVLIIGSGLTAIDLVMTLQQRQHRGQIDLFSRRGLIPQVHQPVRTYPLTLLLQHSQSLRDWLRWLRQEIEIAASQGYDWRSVIDSLRPFTPVIWQSWSLADRRRFLRHLRPYWENHRHRMAPAMSQTLSDLQATGQLQIHAGRIQTMMDDNSGVNVVFRQRRSQTLKSLCVQQVINCTHAAGSYDNGSNRLVNSLLNSGLSRSDCLNLGLDAAVDGAVVNAAGVVSSWLYTLGNPMQGQLWECTAIPEIRQQAQNLAQTLLQNMLWSSGLHVES